MHCVCNIDVQSSINIIIVLLSILLSVLFWGSPLDLSHQSVWTSKSSFIKWIWKVDNIETYRMLFWRTTKKSNCNPPTPYIEWLFSFVHHFKIAMIGLFLCHTCKRGWLVRLWWQDLSILYTNIIGSLEIEVSKILKYASIIQVISDDDLLKFHLNKLHYLSTKKTIMRVLCLLPNVWY